MMKKFNFFVIFLALLLFYDVVDGEIVTVAYPEEAQMNTEKLITRNGYPLEIHYVTTEDGYILKVHRIPAGSHCENGGGKKPYPLVAFNGLLLTSRSYIIVRKGFGFAAADECYDVWLPNTRGNYESRNHTFLDPNKPEFWQYGFYEKGVYDIPAVIDYILVKTNAPQVQYVGHSQGSSIFFILSSLFPEYVEKTIRSAHVLSPVVFTKKSSSPFYSLFSKHLPSDQYSLNNLGVVEIPRSKTIVPLLSRLLCTIQRPVSLNACAQFGFYLIGNGEQEFNATTYLSVFGFAPSGISVRELLTGAQWQLSGKFARYNFFEDNMKVYGQPTPPEYPAITSRVPVYLYASENDLIADPADVTLLTELVPTAIRVDNSEFAQFNLLDFVTANTVDVVNRKILANVAIYN